MIPARNDLEEVHPVWVLEKIIGAGTTMCHRDYREVRGVFSNLDDARMCAASDQKRHKSMVNEYEVRWECTLFQLGVMGQAGGTETVLEGYANEQEEVKR